MGGWRICGVVLLLAGCAAPPPVAPAAAPGPGGWVAARRPVALPGGAGAEFVVRADDGRTLSVVQPGGAGLAVGARVRLVPGPPTTLAPEGG